MLARWFAGLLIFALGFGCAHVVKVTTAEGQELEQGLQYMDNGNEYEVTNTGSNAYLVVIDRKPGSQVGEPPIGVKAGTASFSKDGLNRLTFFKVTPTGAIDPTLAPAGRDCHPPNPEDCPFPLPDPPPPPPFFMLLEPGRP